MGPTALMGRDRQATQIRHTPKRIRAGRETIHGPLLVAGSANVATPTGCSNATWAMPATSFKRSSDVPREFDTFAASCLESSWQRQGVSEFAFVQAARQSGHSLEESASDCVGFPQQETSAATQQPLSQAATREAGQS